MDENQLVQLREIIGALTVRTHEGRIEWAWDEDMGSVTATLANGRVILSRDRDFDTVMVIQDADSNFLERINVGYRQYVDLKFEEDELYRLARRSALQVDSKLDSILREISA